LSAARFRKAPTNKPRTLNSATTPYPLMDADADYTAQV
jgi:hypothetical protein